MPYITVISTTITEVGPTIFMKYYAPSKHTALKENVPTKRIKAQKFSKSNRQADTV